MHFQPFCSAQVLFCSKEEMKEKLLGLSTAYITLILSESGEKRWALSSFVSDLKAECEKNGGRLIRISKIAANPTQKDILEALKQTENTPLDLILAIGGGSAIDLAKCISAFHKSGKMRFGTIEDITESIRSKSYQEGEFIDIIALPSTAGTGSEVTPWATVWDENKAGKFSIEAPGLKPVLSIIVPELTLSLPPLPTLSSGLDALCHAVESYWSRHTTPAVQQIAWRAVDIIIENLKKVQRNPDNLEIREKLSTASFLSGLAFSQTRTTACHSISYPLTLGYGVPHGLAAAMTLDSVGRINRGHFPNEQDLFDLFEPYGGIGHWVDEVCGEIVHLRLSSFGITEEDISGIAEMTFTKGRMDNNPVHLETGEVIRILTEVL